MNAQQRRRAKRLVKTLEFKAKNKVTLAIKPESK